MPNHEILTHWIRDDLWPYIIFDPHQMILVIHSLFLGSHMVISNSLYLGVPSTLTRIQGLYAQVSKFLETYSVDY